MRRRQPLYRNALGAPVAQVGESVHFTLHEVLRHGLPPGCVQIRQRYLAGEPELRFRSPVEGLEVVDLWKYAVRHARRTHQSGWLPMSSGEAIRALQAASTMSREEIEARDALESLARCDE